MIDRATPPLLALIVMACVIAICAAADRLTRKRRRTEEDKS